MATAYYRSDIQALRALAVSLVALYHFDLGGLAGGFVGVDVFFVISGYLITGLLARQVAAGGINFVDFYANRLRRLLPAALLMLVTTLIVFSQLLPPVELKIITSSAVSSLLYVSNLLFAYRSTDYLGGSAESDPLLHTWSLGVEEQFYLAWPIVIALLWRTSVSQASRLRFVMGLTVALFAVNAYVTQVNQPLAFFLPLTRAWQFAVGAMLALMALPMMGLAGRLMMRLSGLMLILAASLWLSAETLYPGYWALLPTMGACLLLMAGRGDAAHHPKKTWWIARPVLILGDISYSVYLWHWPIAVLLVNLGFQGLEHRLGGLFVSLLLGYLSFRLVENPLRRKDSVYGVRWRALANSALASLIVLGLALVYREQASVALSTPEQQRLLSYRQDIPDVYADGCVLTYLEADVKHCQYGNDAARKVVVLFGDSHAAHWFPAFLELAERQNWKLLVMSKVSCPSVLYDAYLTKFKRPYTECTQWRQSALAKIKAVNPDLVFVSNFVYQPYSWQRGWVLEGTNKQRWGQAVDALINEFGSGTTQLIFIRDVPLNKTDLISCLSAAAFQARNLQDACAFNTRDQLDQDIHQVELSRVQKWERVEMLDLTLDVCSSELCDVIPKGYPIYSDSSHLTATYARALAPALYRQLESKDGLLDFLDSGSAME